MKTIGLIGGISWESTAHYYRALNQTVKARLGGHHSAKLVMVSVDFEEIHSRQRAGRWDELGDMLNLAALGLERAGAELLLICANTMHKVADETMRGVSIPLLHIADATAERARALGVKKVALLGTRWTMEQDFYKSRLVERHGLAVLVPDGAARDEVDRVIFDELVHGRVEPTSRQHYREIMADLVRAGAQGVIAGCTEISLLVGPDDVQVPFFDTTEEHVRAAVDLALV